LAGELGACAAIGPLLAQSGHAERLEECPLSGGKADMGRLSSMSGPALLAPNRKSVDQTALLNVVLLDMVLLAVG
jgi:hypothetical protein